MTRQHRHSARMSVVVPFTLLLLHLFPTWAGQRGHAIFGRRHHDINRMHDNVYHHRRRSNTCPSSHRHHSTRILSSSAFMVSHCVVPFIAVDVRGGGGGGNEPDESKDGAHLPQNTDDVVDSTQTSRDPSTTRTTDGAVVADTTHNKDNDTPLAEVNGTEVSRPPIDEIITVRNGDDDEENGESDLNSPSSSSSTVDVDHDDDSSSVVGVKQHHANNKKSNAVGDPDGEGSSDDEDDDEEIGNLEDYLSAEDWDEAAPSIIVEESATTTADETTTTTDETNLHDVLERVEVEVEYAVEDDNNGEESDATATTKPNKNRSNNGGGGVGVRLGQRFKRNRKGPDDGVVVEGIEGQSSSPQKSLMERHLQSAWLPHVYLPPPSSFLFYLQQHAKAMDTDGRTRLDRRTLYGGLLLEWTTQQQQQQPSSASSSSRSNRKFIDSDISQSLQAALSLATQPMWRKTLQRPSAIRLYDNTDSLSSLKGCTLAMQESIALALAHSLGVGMVVLDDNILSTVRQQLLTDGYSDEDVKPAALIHSVLALARQGALQSYATASSNHTNAATVSKLMQCDLDSGLDDPFDERATSSSEDMIAWETSWWATNKTTTSTTKTSSRGGSPLVIFLRTQSATSLLKSKSALDALLTECNSTDSRNFLILGRGIDVTTQSVPKEAETQDPHQASNMFQQQGMLSQNLQNAAPWFGFPPHNQNASGQNDPEGSRRFNIFLARTTDPTGAPGIVGAIAPPEAGNLFPHMMAMQAQQHMGATSSSDDDDDASAELKRWTQLLQNQMQTNSGMPLPPPQFFNATFRSTDDSGDGPSPAPQLSTEVVQQALEMALSELLDRLAQLNEESAATSDLSPDLQRAFAQVLRNENLRKGISENLARAAPALSDPKCQGVLLSVFVPPPTFHVRGQDTGSKENKHMSHNMGSWFSKMLHHQEESDAKKEQTEESRRSAKQKRVRTMAAAAAVIAAEGAKDDAKVESKAARNLAKLEAVCHPIIVKTPSDPVRAKSWDAWIGRERGAVIFRQNRQALNQELEKHSLLLQERTGTRGAGSALRQMLSVRNLTDEMGDVIKRAIELEAAKSQRLQDLLDETQRHAMNLDVDVTLSQIVLTENGLFATKDILDASTQPSDSSSLHLLHPSSVEAALTTVCKISPSPAGWLAVPSDPVSHRTRDEISALAQDKHERALVSQVVSPQDIGVTYDMIGGLSEVKELLRQSITYPLKFPHLYSEGIAREAVKGVLLFGPPGTGKTMLAKAVATEGGASFLSVDASSVENKWLGESEKNAKAVFTLARRLAPCVIFIDEVDSLLSSREGSSDDSAHGTLTSVKTTMMSEWDGLNSGTNGEGCSDRVVVIGSTNRPFDLDEAVLRRFPRRILVDLPDLKTRTEILEVTLAENRLDPAVNLTKIAERLEGYTGSDIKECCREAVVQISHEQARILDQGYQNSREEAVDGTSLQRLRSVTMDDFDKALRKLKRSVSEKGRELARVWEWNDEYGEIKRENKNHLPHLANMYL